jgi:hypothetical protein
MEYEKSVHYPNILPGAADGPDGDDDVDASFDPK